MPRAKRDEVREQRIDAEAVVDAYGEAERAMGWYYYLERKLPFPFTARCTNKRATSVLAVGEKVKVVGMASETECEHGIFVTVSWQRRRVAVPLSQLEVIDGDDETREGVDDWRYWVSRGYEF